MRILRPRQSFTLDYTPKQWVGVCNSILLLIVTAMCGMVIYEVFNLDQRFINIIDSSVTINDLLALARMNSYKTPYWKNATESISLYSAFYKKMHSDDNIIIVIGSTNEIDEVRFRNLRCLIKYDENEDLTVTYVQHQYVLNCTTLFLYCVPKLAKIPSKVAIVSYTSNIPAPWINIEKIPPKPEASSEPPKIAICVKPLSKYISVDEIADFVAYNEIIGIKHFFFYDHALSRDTVSFLRQLVATGHSINLLPWNKDKETQRNCHSSWSEYVQDCLHRATHKYNFVLTTDIYDYFVPSRYFLLSDLFDSAKKASFNFRLRKANFCNLFRSNNHNGRSDSLRNMIFRGEYYPSNTNFILRPELTTAINFYESDVIEDGRNNFQLMTEYDGAVRHLTRKCDANANLDTGVMKYITALDRSLVLEAYKHASEAKVQLTRHVSQA